MLPQPPQVPPPVARVPKSKTLVLLRALGTEPWLVARHRRGPRPAG